MRPGDMLRLLEERVKVKIKVKVKNIHAVAPRQASLFFFGRMHSVFKQLFPTLSAIALVLFESINVVFCQKLGGWCIYSKT